MNLLRAEVILNEFVCTAYGAKYKPFIKAPQFNISPSKQGEMGLGERENIYVRAK